MKIVNKKIEPKLSHCLLSKDSFKINDILTHDIYIKKDKDYVIIIEAGTLVSSELYIKLMQQDDLYIDVKDTGKDKLTYKSLKNYVKYYFNDVEKRVYFLYQVNEEHYNTYMDNKNNRINIECIKSLVDTIIFLIKADKSFIYRTVPFLKNDKTVSTHSLHVALYSINLGIELGFKMDQLIQIGTAALLHDIGYKKIDPSILGKNDQLSEDEINEVQKHVQYSVEILKLNQIDDPYIIDAVMHHHERYDGSGYPKGLMEKDISDFASMLSVCDVFDALTNHRPYRKEFSSFDALKLMLKDPSMENKFNQEYLKIGIKLL